MRELAGGEISFRSGRSWTLRCQCHWLQTDKLNILARSAPALHRLRPTRSLPELTSATRGNTCVLLRLL